MEFPRFDGEGVRIGLDNCEAYFLMYNIPENFKIMSTSLHLCGNAAHWYQSVKFTEICGNWLAFGTAIRAEFDTNVHKNCMRELLVLKQTGTVQEYRAQFNQLVYRVRLCEGGLSETMLVTQFILGLKEEIKGAVEIQLPTTVHKAAEYALVQESLLDRGKTVAAKQGRQFPVRSPQGRYDPGKKPAFSAGDVWKARQLKEYRRANGLCYGCGEKYVPGHQCAPKAQAKAIEVETDGVILSDAILDAVSGEEMMEEAAAFLTANAISGTTHPKSI